jgi:hypothetical protein
MNLIKYFSNIFSNKDTSTEQTTTSDNLTLQYYEITVCYDFIHGDYNKLIEIYIPELDISINDSSGIILINNSSYRYNTTSSTHPTLLKSTIITKNSELGKTLLLFIDVHNIKHRTEHTLKTLFT